MTSDVGAGHVGSDMGLAIGDIENDGDFDIFSTNIMTHVMYVNDGTGHFTNEASQRGTNVIPLTGWGTAFVDLDHDRDQDLVYIGTGQPGALFENDGSGHFSMVETTSCRWEGHCLVPFDYDRDGDIDFLVLRNLHGRIGLLENRSRSAQDRHWLMVRLQGTVSNRDGVGAKVEVNAGGVKMIRPMINGYSFKAGPPVEAHFGLRQYDQVDVKVTWPNGTVQVLQDVAADQELLIVEPEE